MWLAALGLGGGLLVNAGVLGYFLGGMKRDIAAIREGLDDKIENRVLNCRQSCPHAGGAAAPPPTNDTAPRGVAAIPG